MSNEITGMKFITIANFESPISADEFKKLHGVLHEFMVKVDEICHDILCNHCPKGCRGFSVPILNDDATC